MSNGQAASQGGSFSGARPYKPASTSAGSTLSGASVACRIDSW